MAKKGGLFSGIMKFLGFGTKKKKKKKKKGKGKSSNNHSKYIGDPGQRNYKRQLNKIDDY